jgi:ABC-type transport system involved in cytochrome c biogenesis permease subunit
MYETVVMMALSAAIFGVWYALYPVLQPAQQLALLYSKFPRLSTLQEWFAAMKTRKAVISSLETEGEATMRGVAEEFGFPGGMTLGGHRAAPPRQDPADGETQQRVDTALRKLTGQCLLTIPRLILTFATFYWIVVLANGSEYVAEHDFFTSAANVFAANGLINLLTVIACVGLMLWYIPRALLTLLMMPVILCRPDWIAGDQGIQSFETKIVVESAPKLGAKAQTAMLSRSEMSGVFHGETRDVSYRSKNSSGAAWLKQARNAALERKLFIAVTAGIVCVVALIASMFSPDIHPIAAVLRSNFWLTVHVTAIIWSYAAAFIAWGIAAVSLGFVVFGRYQRIEPEQENEKKTVLLPAQCQMFTPIIEVLLKIALLLLIIGTVLGARWADYAWGRFWSWDPKEVWALITILFFVIVFHGKAARYYGAIGITVGALFASIAVVITWYGVNFIFNGSIHAYGGGSENNASLFLFVFIAVNLLWGTLALLRYIVEVHGSESEI